MSQLTSQFTIAIPSKGRLQEQTLAFFERAALKIAQARGARDYVGVIRDLPDASVQFRSASEIARLIGSGEVHLAVTGLDLIHETLGPANTELPARDKLETEAPRPAHIVTPLGFGHADVVVAVPQAWLDVSTMADLADVAARFRLKHHRPMRVATKYVSLTRRFFARHGLNDYLIVESPGATEGTPAAGTAEFIVDITSTGQTLVENALKILDDGRMMRSEAVLVASLDADWSADVREQARAMFARIAGDARAREVKLVSARVANPDRVAAEAANLFGAETPFGTDLPKLELICPRGKVPALAAHLVASGASGVLVQAVEAAWSARNPLYEQLAARLT